MIKRLLLLSISIMVLQSCGIMGIHFKVHNPKKMGKYPKFDEETILLGELTPVRSSFDVTFYNLDVELFPKTKTVGGWVEIQAVAKIPIDSIQLDLDQPLDIESIRWSNREGTPLSYNRKYRAVFIKLPTQLNAGAAFSVHVKYLGKPVIAKKPPWNGGVVWKKDANKNPWLGVSCESEGASLWFPCKDHTADEPDSAHLNFTIADTSVMVVSNGQFTGSTSTNGRQTYHWKVTYPINLYNITYYVGDFEKIEDHYTGINGKDLHLTHYVLPYNAAKARQHFKQVKKHLRVYEEIYGEYPWYNDGFKLVESPYAGMEHQSAIAYGNSYQNDLNGTDDYIIVHEAGHEWFGNAITASDLADVWLQEGFTTYGEALYLEREYGPRQYLNHLLFYRLMIANKRPLAGPVGRRYFDYRDGDVYVKGAWVLHSLRNTIGNDSLFFQVIRGFYNDHKLTTTNSSAFIATVNEVTGDDYTWFFDQYLYQHKVPFLEYEYTEEGEFYYRWTEVVKNFNGLPIWVTFPNAEEQVKLYPTTEAQLYKPNLGKALPLQPTIINDKTLFGIDRNRKLAKAYL